MAWNEAPGRAPRALNHSFRAVKHGRAEQQAALRPHLETFQVAAAALSLRDWELGHTFTIALTFGQVTLQTEEVRNNRNQVDINMVKRSSIYRISIDVVYLEYVLCAVVLSVLLLHSAGKLYDLLVRGNAAWAWAGREGLLGHPLQDIHRQCLTISVSTFDISKLNDIRREGTK